MLIHVSLMMDLVAKFTNQGELVVNCFMGAFVVTEACQWLQRHRILVSCDMYEDCREGSTESVVEVYNIQLLNPE